MPLSTTASSDIRQHGDMQYYKVYLLLMFLKSGMGNVKFVFLQPTRIFRSGFAACQMFASCEPTTEDSNASKRITVVVLFGTVHLKVLSGLGASERVEKGVE